jgi:hypothetical protein
MNFGNIKTVFDDAGTLLDQSYVRRADRFIKELIWMATTLRHGREHVSTN